MDIQKNATIFSRHSEIKKSMFEISLAVQQLRICTSTAGAWVASIPSWGTKIPHASMQQPKPRSSQCSASRALLPPVNLEAGDHLVSTLGYHWRHRINDTPKGENLLCTDTSLPSLKDQNTKRELAVFNEFHLLFFIHIFIIKTRQKFNYLVNAIVTVLSRGPKCQPQHHNVIIIRWRTIQNVPSENVKTAGSSRRWKPESTVK